MQSQIGSQKSATSVYSDYHPQFTTDYASPQSDKPDIDQELRRLKQEQEEYIVHRSSLQSNPVPPNALNLSLDRQSSINEYAQQNADEQWGDPYATASIHSPPMSATSFKSKGSARSRGSHRAPRKASTPARFEPNREGRPLDSPMTATTATSPVMSNSHFQIAQSMTSHDERTLSIVPSIAPVQDDTASLSIVPSVAPTQDDYQQSSIVPSIAPTNLEHTSSVNENQLIDPTVLQYTPSNLDRNASIASNRTIPQSIFKDFDGVHLSPLVDEEIREEDERELILENLEAEAKSERGGDEVRPTSEYELWFQQQWQQAENHIHKDEHSEVHSHSGSIHGAAEGSRRSVTPQPWAEPPPEEGMHYYPAPVPRDIKLPQRLSRQLPAEKMAKRRSQVLGELGSEARKSAIWLQDDHENSVQQVPPGLESPTRAAEHRKQRSIANVKNLPPQLRASIFFGQEAVPHHVELKDGSATATLEHMLDVSVMGPPKEELGPRHPDAVGKRRKSRGSMSALDNDGRNSRASMISGALKSGRASRASILSSPLGETKTDGRASRASMLSGNGSASFDGLAQAGNRSSSAMSLSRFSFEDVRNSSALELENPALRVVNGSKQGDEFEHNRHLDSRSDLHALEGDQDLDDHGDVHRVSGEPGDAEVDGGQLEVKEEEEEGEERDSDEFDEAIHGPPTTLLAELQLRKQKLKQRNRTAVSAFPNGMHSTLLEMDAVAQIEKKRRKGKPTTLAWEDPSAKGTPAEADDDDVPLGMLFPEKKGLIAKGRNEWDRPLGLLQQKEREENEPLSKRRNRLFGAQQPISAQQATQMQESFQESQQTAGQQHDKEGSEHEGETLAQRTRRLRSTRALDDAIGGKSRDGAQSRALSEDFASEMISTFGPVDGAKQDVDVEKRHSQENALDAEPESETLGQRRRRLQREAAAGQVATGAGSGTPMLQPNPSMGNLLAQVPASAFAARNVSGESGVSSGLLGANDEKRARERQQIADQNFRSSSGMGINTPLVDAGQRDAQGSKDVMNRGGAGRRQTFMPGQYSGLRSKSSQDLLQNTGQQQPQQSQQQQNPWAGIAPQTFSQGLGAVGSNFQSSQSPKQPFPNFVGNSGAAMFASDPKGGVTHQPNQGSMLWSQEQSRRVSMLPRQWSDGNFGFMGTGPGKTYASHAQVQQPSYEQMQGPAMSDLQRAKIEQWRTSIMQ